MPSTAPTHWHAVFEEDFASRGYIFLQKGQDESSRELFDTLAAELVEAPGFERRLTEQLAAAKDEAARRNAEDEQAAIAAKTPLPCKNRPLKTA